MLSTWGSESSSASGCVRWGGVGMFVGERGGGHDVL